MMIFIRNNCTCNALKCIPITLCNPFWSQKRSLQQDALFFLIKYKVFIYLFMQCIIIVSCEDSLDTQNSMLPLLVPLGL